MGGFLFQADALRRWRPEYFEGALQLFKACHIQLHFHADKPRLIDGAASLDNTITLTD